MGKEQYLNTITLQVKDLEALAPVQVEKCFDLEKLSKVIDSERAKKLRRVVFVGCGDSYSAVGSMQLGFSKLSGIKVITTPDIMDFDAYYTAKDLFKGYAPEETMLVAVSASGGSQTIVDALNKAAGMGAATLLITNNVNSISAQAAQLVYNTETPAGLNTPGLRSYFANMVAILSLAAYIGICKGKCTGEVFDNTGKQIVSYVSDFMKDFESIDDQMFELALKWKELFKFEVVADWNETYSAQFVEQKIYECSGAFAVHTNSEEWCHIGCMMRDPEEVGSIFMMRADERSFGRMIDSIYEAYMLERPILIVSDTEDKTPFAEFEESDVCLVAKAPEKYLSPLMDYIPGSLLAAYHSAVNELNFFQGRYDFRTQEWNRG